MYFSNSSWTEWLHHFYGKWWQVSDKIFGLRWTEYLNVFAVVKGSAAVKRNPTTVWLKNEVCFLKYQSRAGVPYQRERRDSWQAMLNVTSFFWSPLSQPIGNECLRDVCAGTGSGTHLFYSHSIGRNSVPVLLHMQRRLGSQMMPSYSFNTVEEGESGFS